MSDLIAVSRAATLPRELRLVAARAERERCQIDQVVGDAARDGRIGR